MRSISERTYSSVGMDRPGFAALEQDRTSSQGGGGEKFTDVPLSLGGEHRTGIGT
jgi:hypothetical protein